MREAVSEGDSEGRSELGSEGLSEAVSNARSDLGTHSRQGDDGVPEEGLHHHSEVLPAIVTPAAHQPLRLLLQERWVSGETGTSQYRDWLDLKLETSATL